MSKDLHDIDDIFNSAYQEHEDDPSPDVWNKINAGLDRKDADLYKRRFLGWKRVAIVLFLLLTGFVLYESGYLKTWSGKPKETITIQKPATPTVPGESDKIKNSNHDLPSFPNTAESNSSRKEIQNKEEDPENITITAHDNTLRNNKIKTNVAPFNLIEQSSVTPKNDEAVSIKKINIVPLIIEKNNSNNIDRLLTLASHFQWPMISDPLLTNRIPKSQKQKQNNHFRPYWTVTGFESTDLAQYRLDNDYQSSSDERLSIQQREEHEPSYSAGILVGWQFNEKLGFQSGLIYSITQIGINPHKMYAFSDPNGNVYYKYIISSGYAYLKPDFGSPPSIGDSLNTAVAKHTLQYISVPLMVKYKMTKNKWSFAPGLGMAANFLTSAKVHTEIEDASNRETVIINKLDGKKSFYLSLVADAALQFNLNKRWSIDLLPTFRFAISPITRNNVVETFPYSFGAGFGVTYRF